MTGLRGGWQRIGPLAVIGALVVLGLIGGPRWGAAQQATPTGGTMTGMTAPHPVGIYRGNCPTPSGSPVAQLADVPGLTAIAVPAARPMAGGSPVASPVGSPMAMASPVAPGGMAAMASPAAAAYGSTSAVPANTSTTQVQLPISQILAAEHSIVVSAAASDLTTAIACGPIGGVPDASGNLFVGLRQVGSSGWSGVAWLHDNRDGTTTITVFLAYGLSGAASGAAAPMASPGA